MKQKNLDEIRNSIISNNSNAKKDKSIQINSNKNKLNENDELSMRKKIFDLSNKYISDKVNYNLNNKNDKTKINMKFFFQQQNIINKSNNKDNHFQKNNLLLIDKKNNNNNNLKTIIGNNNYFNINHNHNDISLKNNKNDFDIKLFSFYNNKKKNYINNIYSVRKNSEEKRKILSKSGNKNINYRKYLFNEKLDKLELYNINNKKDIKVNDMEHKGLFYLYNLQNSIYNNNKKIKNSKNYPSFNIFNQTNKDRPIILFPKSFNNSLNKKTKYNTLNNKKIKPNFNEIFINMTNGQKVEENIFHNKMKLRKHNFLTANNFDNTKNKFKLKLIRLINNNKTELLLNDDNNKNNLLNIKNISKNNNSSSLNNISEISKISTAVKDAKYYMNKSSALIKYIQNFYSKNKSYPETKKQK